MMRVLTKEEGDKVEKELNEWLLNLDFNTKANLRKILENYYNIEKNRIKPNRNIEAPEFRKIKDY